jgi:hypothetical protein
MMTTASIVPRQVLFQAHELLQPYAVLRKAADTDGASPHPASCIQGAIMQGMP